MDELQTLKGILEEIKDALVDVAKAHNCEHSQCGLTFHPTGIITIDVKGEPIYYCFSSSDLLNWIKAK